MKYYVDFAAQSGLPSALLDTGWSAQGDITQLMVTVDVPALVKYAATKGAKVWIGLPCMPVAAQMRAAFPLDEQWGVAGVKIDFFARDDQVNGRTLGSGHPYGLRAPVRIVRRRCPTISSSPG